MATCGKNPFAGMNKRLAIQAVTQTADGQGGWTETWATVATVWASIEPVKGWEKMQAAQMETPVTHNVTMRYRSGVTTKHRILYGTRIFDIKECLNDKEEGVVLKLKALELDGVGLEGQLNFSESIYSHHIYELLEEWAA